MLSDLCDPLMLFDIDAYATTKASQSLVGHHKQRDLTNALGIKVTRK